MTSTLARQGHRRIAVPNGNADEARMVEGVEVVGVDGLDDVARLVAGPRGRVADAARRRPALQVSAATGRGRRRSPAGATDAQSAAVPGLAAADLADVRGQPMARWALEVALAGGHDLLLVGSPGAGKTLLARTVPGLLPPLDDREAQEVAVIRSVAGLRPDPAERRVRPFRAPHHTTSYAAMVGGGPLLQPGLVTLAHRGVLFLDELAEFDRNVLDALRQPLEDGTVEIARAHGHVRYPARLQLIAAMNPCRCGWFGEQAGVLSMSSRRAAAIPAAGQWAAAGPHRPAGGHGAGCHPRCSSRVPAGEPSSVVAERIARARAARPGPRRTCPTRGCPRAASWTPAGSSPAAAGCSASCLRPWA